MSVILGALLALCSGGLLSKRSALFVTCVPCFMLDIDPYLVDSLLVTPFTQITGSTIRTAALSRFNIIDV